MNAEKSDCLQNSRAPSSKNLMTKSRLCIDIYSVLCLFFVIAACFLGSSRSTVLSIAVVAGFAVFVFKPQYLIGPVFFMTVFDDCLIAFSGQSFSRFCVLFFCIGIMLKLVTGRRHLHHIPETALVIIMLMLGIGLSYVSSYGYTSFPLSYVLNLALFFCMMEYSVKDIRMVTEHLYRYSALGIAFIIWSVAQNGIGGLFSGRFTIGSVNPNQLAMGLTQMSAVVIAHFFINKKKTSDLFLLILIFTCLFLTGSRTGLIAAVLSIVLIYLITICNTASKRKRAKTIGVMFFTCALAVALYVGLSRIAPAIMNRFTYSSIVSSGGTHRIDIWTALLTGALPGHYLFGIGFDPMNAYNAVRLINGIGHGSHNLIIEIITKTGIVGLCIFLSFFWRLFKNMVSNLKQRTELLMPLAMSLAISISGIGEDVLTSRYLWFGLGLGFVVINSKALHGVNESVEGKYSE